MVPRNCKGDHPSIFWIMVETHQTIQTMCMCMKKKKMRMDTDERILHAKSLSTRHLEQ